MTQPAHSGSRPHLPHSHLVQMEEERSDSASCIHQLIEAQVEKTPDVVAVTCADRQMTYRELDHRANQLAHLLKTAGVGPEVLVAICMDRSEAMLVGLLGILKAGGAYLPLDPAYPADRLSYMLADAQAKVLVTQKELQDTLPEHGAGVVLLDTDWKTISAENADSPHCETGSDHLAYVVYTSGSTGKPKGVEVVHRGVVNFLESMRRCPGMNAKDRLLAVTSVSCDMAVLELFLPLTVGACLEIATRQAVADVSQLSSCFAAFRPTVMQATPATWRLLLKAGWQGHNNLRILSGGGALPRELANQLLKQCDSLWNLYGSAETTVWSTLHQVRLGTKPVFIGQPIANTEIHVLDQDFQPVNSGEPGELYVSGPGLARKYRNRSELTSQNLIANPFRPGTRLYKTSDLVRQLPSGDLEFLGKMEHQHKVRGFRIELEEIEAVLCQHPSINQAVVMARKDDMGDKRLAAYLVPRPDKACDIPKIRDYLKYKLPRNMVPSALVPLASFPQTPNSRLDFMALPAPDQAGGRAKVLTPRNEIEMQLTQIWEELFSMQSIGVQDDFIELGGDSILAVELGVAIEERFGQKLSANSLFQGATIEKLAAMLTGNRSSAPWSPVVGIQTRGSRKPFFCVHPIMGQVMCYLPLSKHMGREQPFYGLQAVGVDGTVTPLNRVEEMAAAYIRGMRTIQPEGPYSIGGWSFGGLVAYEIACQLHRLGQPVDLLALIDAGILYGFAVMLALLPDQNRLSLVGNARLGNPDQMAYFKERSEAHNMMTPGLNPEQVRNIFDGFLANVDAKFAYRPQPYPGKITLLQAADTSMGGGRRSPLADWRKSALGGIEVHTIPGNHITLMQEPNIRVLAQQLNQLLQHATTSQPVKKTA